MRKLLIVVGLSLTMFGCSCGVNYTYRCSDEDKSMMKESFEYCVNRTNNPHQCKASVKQLFCKKIIEKND